MSFSNQATLIAHLNNTMNATALGDVIRNTTWKDQNTNTSGALWYMWDIMFSVAAGDRLQAPNVGIVITDGASNYDENLTLPTALVAKDKGITLISLGIGTDVDYNELLGIASSSDLVLTSISFDALDLIQEQIVTIACDIPVGEGFTAL